MIRIAGPTQTFCVKHAALSLRLGLGLVFVIGGWNKLSQLIDPAREAAIVASYMSPHGYINAFFDGFLFDGRFGSWLTPWLFLTSLSAFELFSGIALLAGLLVRPLALIYGFLLWTFVMALPVATAPEVAVTVNTFTSPALLVQIRDVALSGLMFVLFNIGAGACSVDARVFGQTAVRGKLNWDHLGLLLRLSLAAPLIVGGMFAGMKDIPTFATNGWLLLLVGLLMLSGSAARIAGTLLAGIMLWFMFTKLDLDKSLIANLNGFKREFAFLAAAGVVTLLGSGRLFRLPVLGDRVDRWLGSFGNPEVKPGHIATR